VLEAGVEDLSEDTHIAEVGVVAGDLGIVHKELRGWHSEGLRVFALSEGEDKGLDLVNHFAARLLKLAETPEVASHFYVGAVKAVLEVILEELELIVGDSDEWVAGVDKCFLTRTVAGDTIAHEVHRRKGDLPCLAVDRVKVVDAMAQAQEILVSASESHLRGLGSAVLHESMNSNNLVFNQTLGMELVNDVALVLFSGREAIASTKAKEAVVVEVNA
jgi:hypothetical protein